MRTRHRNKFIDKYGKYLIFFGVFIGVLFAAIGAWSAWDTADLYLNGETAIGEVVGYDEISCKRGDCYARIISYMDNRGRPQRGTERLGSRNPMELYSRVEVLYKLEDPTTVVVKDNSEILGSFIAAGIFITIGVAVIILSIKTFTKFQESEPKDKDSRA